MRKRYSILIFILVVTAIAITAYFSLPLIFGSTIAPLPDQYRSAICSSAAEYKVNPHLVAGVINAESTWNPRVISGAGARGLMQLTPGTAYSIASRIGLTGYRLSDLTNNPDINIKLGTALLAYNFQTYGNLRNVLVAYNAGGGRVYLPDAYLPLETRFYISKVSSYYNLYTSLYPDMCNDGGNKSTYPYAASAPTPTPSPTPQFPQFTGAQTDASPIDPTQFWKFLFTSQ